MSNTFSGMGNFSGVGNYSSGKIDGVGSIGGGSYEQLKIDGVAAFNGDVQVGKLSVDGVLNAHGAVSASELDCNGMATFYGNLRVGHADIDGMVHVKGEKVEADEIVCDGYLRVNGEVSADKIRVYGFIKADEIVGDDIKIDSMSKNFVVRLWDKFKDAVGIPQFSEITLIEATTVELRGVRAKQVNAHDMVVGANCKIEQIHYTGTLSIDPSAEVASSEKC
jgi:cytoskeletal protein CcmA (bactofilin family)